MEDPPQEDSATSNQNLKVKSSKRKRKEVADATIEIDPSLPEPLSKKAQRKLKKPKVDSKPDSTSDSKNSAKNQDEVTGETAPATSKKISEHGIWIGNLPWTATKASLRAFLKAQAKIDEDRITRIHLPAPTKAAPSKQFAKPQNKGFAYVDFSDASAVEAAVAISETLMDGRRVLVKGAKSFEGRPEKPTQSESEKEQGRSIDFSNPPSRRVFVGNLGFDVTKDDIIETFAPCGEIDDIHIATFEDSGKCKGYGWVTFDYAEAAASAVRGWIPLKVPAQKQKKDTDKENGDSGTGSGEDGADQEKPRKWFVNKLKGRLLRCEFAEDPAARYQRRFGKGKAAEGEEKIAGNGKKRAAAGKTSHRNSGNRTASRGSRHNDPRQKRGNTVNGISDSKVDARTIKPGAAHANAQRATAAIVDGEGTKTTFD